MVHASAAERAGTPVIVTRRMAGSLSEVLNFQVFSLAGLSQGIQQFPHLRIRFPGGGQGGRDLRFDVLAEALAQAADGFPQGGGTFAAPGRQFR